MASLWSATWDRWLRRYETVIVARERDRQACMDLLDAPARRAWTRLFGASVLEGGRGATRRDDDLLIAVEDRRSGEIVGCARTAGFAGISHLPGAAHELAADRVGQPLHDQVRACTSLVLDPKHSRGAAAWMLLERVVAEAFRHDARLLVLACDPTELPLYLEAGFRPLAPVHGTPTGGFRIPLVLVLHDRVQLEDVRSPLRSLLRSQPSPMPVEGLHWWFAHRARFEDEDLCMEWAPPDTELPFCLVDGVSSAGRRALLSRAYRVRCRPGQRIVAQGGPPVLGVVQSGELHVVFDDHYVDSLSADKLFGVLGILRGGYSPVEIVAPDWAEVLVVPERGLTGGLSHADRAALQRNLSQLATDRAGVLRAGRGRPQGGQPRVTSSPAPPRRRTWS